jgi:hypothetical protein
MPELKPSRALGIAALVIALVPVIALVAVAAYPMVFPAPSDSFGWLFLIAAVLMVATPICAVVALILGIMAARRNRGRVAGIIAIVLAGLTLLYSLFGLAFYVLAAMSGPY